MKKQDTPWTERHIEFSQGRNEYIRASHVRVLENHFDELVEALVMIVTLREHRYEVPFIEEECYQKVAAVLARAKEVK